MSDIYKLLNEDIDMDLLHDKEFMDKLTMLKRTEKTIIGLTESADRMRSECVELYQRHKLGNGVK